MIKQTYLILSILLGICFTACQDNDIIDNSSVVEGNMVEVSIKTNVPAITVHTKAEASKEEKKLTHVDVLVFDVDNQNKETFAYHTTHSNNLNALEYENEIVIKAKLKISENNQRIVFIANLKDEVKTLLNEYEQSQTGSISKKDILENLTFTQEKIWTDTDTEPHPLPMWGESAVTTVTENMPSLSINLLRSVARIGLSVSINSDLSDLNDDGSDIFEIKSVNIYNARKTGLAAPGGELTEGKVTSPSLVSGSEIIDIDTNTPHYTLPDNAGNKVSGIYINEASNQTKGEEVFLIIKAIYKKEDPTNQEATFYKVGFYDDNKDPVDILRNFNYNMIITDVKGPGEDTEEDAKKSNSSNLVMSMTEWSDGEMKYVVFNGQYYLAVSESKKTISKLEGTQSFKVTTNYCGGWKAKVSEGNDWIDENLVPGSSNKYKEIEPLYFNVTENTGKENRKGKITITCGDNHLSLDVYIIQTTEIEYTLKIMINNSKYPEEPDEFIEFDRIITFPSGYHYPAERPLATRTLKIEWTPANIPLKLEFNPYFDWGSETDTTSIYDQGTGVAIFDVVPTKLKERAQEDWYPEAVGDIQVQIGDDSNTKQNVLIRRRHHEVYIEKADKYILDGDWHSFQLYSNTDWEIVYNSNINPESAQQYSLNEVVEEFNKREGGFNLEKKDGDAIKFKLINSDQNISDDITLSIKFLDVDEYFTKDYLFHIYNEADPTSNTRFAEAANCYVLQTGGKAVSIPVSQANRFKNEKNDYFPTNPIGDNDELKVEFIWTDHKNGFDKDNNGDCPVISAEIDYTEGRGPKARLIVTSGNAPGNAVIAVTNSQGKIHWSWHIWVVDKKDGFDPYNSDYQGYSYRYYEFMDRNLGALSNEPGAPESMGLYYQWGRKDPFPAASGIKSQEFSERFDKEGNSMGTLLDVHTNQLSWGNYYLQHSIENPTQFIAPTNTTNWCSGDWSSTQTADFWNETEGGSLSTSIKGIFDPCPEGWKTPPGGSQLDQSWYSIPQIVEYKESGNYSIIEGNNINLGIWPHAGYISSGKIINEKIGAYWTGTSNDFYNGFRTYIWGTKLAEPSTSHNKKDALSVKCMRRTETPKL